MSTNNKKPSAGRTLHREKLSDDLLWGINPVHEALVASSLSEIYVQRGKGGRRLQEIIDLARENSVRLRFVEPNRMGVPTSCRHQGVVARRAETVFLSFAELLGKFAEANDSNCKLLILDSIQDPRNLGSILRSALAAGFRYVILTRERSAPVSGTVARTSAGALAHLHLCQVVNLAETLKELTQHGFWIYGAVPADDAQSIYETDFSGNIGLVVGSEDKGIRPLIKKSCDHLVTIPMQSTFDSLNVSVAAAIIMFEIVRSQTA
jgi:23S rRNA (guanosine2251-2'-O)-methyltransferase